MTIEADRVASLASWLRHDVPSDVRDHLLEWLAQEKHGTVVPARLRSRLLPDLPSLIDRVQDHALDQVDAIGR